jgi:hypothetical protein
LFLSSTLIFSIKHLYWLIKLCCYAFIDAHALTTAKTHCQKAGTSTIASGSLISFVQANIAIHHLYLSSTLVFQLIICTRLIKLCCHALQMLKRFQNEKNYFPLAV